MDERKVIKVRHYKAGYELRYEVLDYGLTEQDIEKKITMRSAYTPDGAYIGDSKWAYLLCKKKRIKPELADPEDNVCSIGFCLDTEKWYGWSHRAIHGFKIGDEVKKGSLCSMSGWTDEYLKEHPEEDISLPVGFVAKTLDDCRRMAVAFAEAVG